MRNCDKCLENYWEYKFNEGMIEATCQHCGNVVEFEAKKKVKEKMRAGDLCRKCKKATITYSDSKFNEKKLKRSYYFTGYFKCPNCKQIYYSEEFKIYNKKNNEQAKAEYKIIDGQRYLKIDGEYKEVELKKVKGGLKICAKN